MMPRVLIASVRRASFMDGESQNSAMVSIIPGDDFSRVAVEFFSFPNCVWERNCCSKLCLATGQQSCQDIGVSKQSLETRTRADGRETSARESLSRIENIYSSSRFAFDAFSLNPSKRAAGEMVQP